MSMLALKNKLKYWCQIKARSFLFYTTVAKIFCLLVRYILTIERRAKEMNSLGLPQHKNLNYHENLKHFFNGLTFAMKSTHCISLQSFVQINSTHYGTWPSIEKKDTYPSQGYLFTYQKVWFLNGQKVFCKQIVRVWHQIRWSPNRIMCFL